MPTLMVRPATDDDCRLLWEWVNDPGVRAMSFRSKPVTWEEHAAWFRATRADAQRAIFIVLDEVQRPVGQVRFEPPDAEGGAEIIISIAGAYRGKGYGTEAVRAACAAYRRTGPARRAVAYIKPENQASLRIFAKAGFTPLGIKSFRDHDAVWMSFEFTRHPARSLSGA